MSNSLSLSLAIIYLLLCNKAVQNLVARNNIIIVWVSNLDLVPLGSSSGLYGITHLAKSDSGSNGDAWSKMVSFTCSSGAPPFSAPSPFQQASLGLFTQWSQGCKHNPKKANPSATLSNLCSHLSCPIGQRKSHGQAQIQRVEK